MKTKYNIPENTKLFKISSFYVNLNDDINRYDTIKLISRYIYSEYYDIEIDIICIQGINDENLVKLLINEVTILSNELRIPINIVPKIDFNDSQDNSIQLTWNVSSEGGTCDISNIIISKYPIITTSKIILNDSVDEKLVGSRKAIIANINIEGYIVSIFNVTLSEDYLGISNSDFRKYELDQLLKYINLNNLEMKKIIETYDLKLIDKNINIICGNFNVSEIKNSKINPEITQIFKNMKALDTFRISNLKNKNNDFTNKNGFKDCFILLLLTDMTFSNDITIEEILNFSYKKHGIIILKSHIENKIQSNDYYPIETIFLLDKKEKKRISD